MRRYVVLVLEILLCLGVSKAQIDEKKPEYFVVVGAFAIKENADRYYKTLEEKGLRCANTLMEDFNLYFVHTMPFDDLELCKQKALEFQKTHEFHDAWVYTRGSIRKIDSLNQSIGGNSNSLEVISQSEDEKPTATSHSLNIESLTLENEKVDSIEEFIAPEPDVFLSLYNENNDKVVTGTVTIVDPDNGKLLGKIDGNTYTQLPEVKNGKDKLLLICDALGYRKIQHVISKQNLITDSTGYFIEDVGTAIVINFGLVKYSKGDIRTLYNVYFFNDAVSMLPESRYELDLLKNMLLENPQYIIRLHGHTNGNSYGKIISMNESDDFFSLPKYMKSEMGSAKKLSTMRAETIRQYLIHSGIDASRIIIKGWGGKKPIYDRHSANAKRNVRVEVEIIND